jgi:hypothetical protein
MRGEGRRTHARQDKVIKDRDLEIISKTFLGN